MPKIYVTRRPPESAIALLNEAFGENNVTVYPEDQPIPRDVLLEAVQGEALTASRRNGIAV